MGVTKTLEVDNIGYFSHGSAEQIRFNWGVKSLPWLILTDKNHIVTAEGFNIAELNEKVQNR